MSEIVGQVAGVVVGIFATPSGPSISVVTVEPDGGKLDEHQAVALAQVLMAAALTVKRREPPRMVPR